jgi:hypothetical protein
MQRSFVALTIWVMLGLVVVACVPQPTQLPTIEPLAPTSTRTTPSLTPSATLSSTHTPGLSLSPTRVSTAIPATDTPVPLPTRYLIPTADSSLPLSRSGPWLSYMTKYEDGNGGITVVNTDGSGRRQVQLNSPSRIIGSPASPYIAVLIRQSEPLVSDYQANSLEIIHLPEMSTRIIPLISSPEIQTHDYSRPNRQLSTKDGIELIAIAVSYKDPAWSPSGRYLAFTAAIDGPTADLYIYDTLNDQIRRLTDGPEMATQPEWSPDSKWIVHRGIESWGEGCFETGVWAAAVDGSEVKWLNKGECFKLTKWIGPEIFETYTPSQGGAVPSGYVGALRRIDIATGTSILLRASRIDELSDKDMYGYDCFTKKQVALPYYEAKNRRIDSPDGKWFVVIPDGIRLYTSDGNLVKEFNQGVKFVGWQPDSKAIVFTTVGNSTNFGTINYFQLASQHLDSFIDIIPSGSDIYELIWTAPLPNFFLEGESANELIYIDMQKKQTIRVNETQSIQGDTFFHWIGVPEIVDNSTYLPCFIGKN